MTKSLKCGMSTEMGGRQNAVSFKRVYFFVLGFFLNLDHGMDLSRAKISKAEVSVEEGE